MQTFGFLLERNTIIAAAIVGALLATAGSLRSKHGRLGPAPSSLLVKAGYALTGASMLMMIVAGFLSGR